MIPRCQLHSTVRTSRECAGISTFSPSEEQMLRFSESFAGYLTPVVNATIEWNSREGRRLLDSVGQGCDRVYVPESAHRPEEFPLLAAKSVGSSTEDARFNNGLKRSFFRPQTTGGPVSSF